MLPINHNEKVKPFLRGYADIIVYANNFVCCFQKKEEAEEFYERLKHFGLELEDSKSRLIEFGRYAEEQCRKNGNTENLMTVMWADEQFDEGRPDMFFEKVVISRT